MTIGEVPTAAIAPKGILDDLAPLTRRAVIAVILGLLSLILAPIQGQSQGMDHAHMDHAMPSTAAVDAAFVITINPEARVSVVMGASTRKPVRCGSVADFAVKVVNQGFVTSRLEAQLVDPPKGVSVDFRPEPLRGIPEEIRHLFITLTRPGETDLTIEFKAHNETPDLGGRDRVHFLVGCR